MRVYEQRWNVVVQWCAAHGIDPERITAGDFADYLEDQFEAGRRYTYLKKHWVAFRHKHGNEKAHDREVKGVLQQVQVWREEKEPEKQAAHIRPEEIDILSEAVRRPRARGRGGLPETPVAADKRMRLYRVAWLMLYHCGMRPSEVSNLEWRDVSAKQDGSGEVAIRVSKTSDIPIIKPVPASVMYEFNLHRIGSKRRKPFPTYGRLLSELHRADRESGLNKGFTLHSFRVGITNYMVANGYTHKQIQDAMGWKSSAMVDRYARNNPEKFNALRDAFGKGRLRAANE